MTICDTSQPTAGLSADRNYHPERYHSHYNPAQRLGITKAEDEVLGLVTVVPKLGVYSITEVNGIERHLQQLHWEFCTASEAPHHTPSPSPSLCGSTEQSNIDPLLRLVSAIVSTPLWIGRAPDHHANYLSPLLNPGRVSQDELGVLLRHSVIPKSIPVDPSAVTNALPFISCQYARMVKHMAFGIPPPSIMVTIMQRLSISAITFSSMTLGARILQSMIEAVDTTDWTGYEISVDKLYWQVCNTPEEGSSLACKKGRLTAAIELTGYKFFLSNNVSGYSFLRGLAPLVMRIAYFYPQIWTRQGKISTQKMLDLGVLELCTFIWTDTMSSALLGTVPLLGYDTSIYEKSNTRSLMEWMNGCPQELILWFSRFNLLRASKKHDGDKLPVGWENIEKEIQALEPIVDKTECSRDNVARLAVVEAWKSTLLIYLYVGVYRVTSSDPRVQSAVNQIIRLNQLVQHRVAFKRHLLAPAIFAGACARLESQRRSITRIISPRRRNQLWILQISDFVSVLQHLWHGAAKDGRPITWDEYIRSRRAVLPIHE